MTQRPEHFGDFKFYSPEHEDDGWGIADGSGWIPVMLADRDACVVLSDLLQCGLKTEQVIHLRDTYNRADPPVLVTTEHIRGVLREPSL